MLGTGQPLVFIRRLPRADGGDRQSIRRDDAGHRPNGPARRRHRHSRRPHESSRSVPRADRISGARCRCSRACRTYLGRISKEIRRADVVHTPVPGDIPLLSLLVANVFRKRLIARYGSSWEHTSETTLMNVMTKALMRWGAGGRNVMLATGAGSAEPAPNMHWLFATAIAQRDINAVRPVLDRPAAKPLRVAYAGRLSPEKGVRHLRHGARPAFVVAAASPPHAHGRWRAARRTGIAPRSSGLPDER